MSDLSRSENALLTDDGFLTKAPDDAAAARAVADSSMTFAGTVALIKDDIRRRLELEGRTANLANIIGVSFMPGVVCVVAYRLANFLFLTKHRILARIVEDLQHIYTGVEIHVGSVVGPGLVYADRPGGGISEHVILGRNCTILGGSTMTLNANGIDPTKGRIILGDHCVVGVGARIVGAVTLAEGTQIKPNAVVFQSSSTAGAILEGMPARLASVAPVEAVRRWNPLKSKPLPAIEMTDRRTEA